MLRAASVAAARGDSRTLYKIAQQAAGKAPEPHKGLRDKSGCLLTDAEDIEGRWVEHYTEMLSAQPITEESTRSAKCLEMSESGLSICWITEELSTTESVARRDRADGHCFKEVGSTARGCLDCQHFQKERR